MRKLLMAFVLSLILAFALAVSAAAADVRYVLADVLNVRSGPSTEHSVTGTLVKGDMVEVTEFTNASWVKVKVNDGKSGYVARRYLCIERQGQSASRSSVVRSRVSYADNSDVIAYAEKFLGVPYQYGGNGPNSFDCSGFVKYVYKNFGVTLTRTTYSQVEEGTYVEKGDLKAGDLVFFKVGGSVSHVGIYAGDDTFIHAPSSGGVVRYQSLSEDYYTKYYYTARRVR